MFLIQRSLLLAMFIPHEDVTPQKYVHSSTQGSAEGGTVHYKVTDLTVEIMLGFFSLEGNPLL
jgi:hypothetical protein